MKRPDPQLRLTLLVWLLVPLLGLLVIDTGLSYWISLRMADLAHDRGLHEIAREVVLHVRAEGALPVLAISPAAERMLLVDQEDRIRYRVWTEAGDALGGDPGLVRTTRPPQRGGDAVFYDDVIEGEPVRIVAVWLPVDASDPGRRVLVQAAETLNKRTRLAFEILGSVVAAQLMLIVMATGAVFVGVSRGLRPLASLKRALAGRSHRDLSALDPLSAPREVRPVIDEVNALMLRLSRTLDLQQRFIADAAHQLKTPVAGLKAQIELALADPDPQQQRRSLAQLHVSAQRLSRLVQQLLSLARNEPGTLPHLRLSALDLDAFALETCMEWVPLALRRAVDLGFDASGGRVMIAGDRDRLKEMLNNLLDNAVRYSREGGRVTVAVRRSANGGAALLVSDDGPSIPVKERDRIFERFHRLLGADQEGSGLGLAIVSEIAALHGASITLEDDVDGLGNTFAVHFPVSGPPSGPAPGPTPGEASAGTVPATDRKLHES